MRELLYKFLGALLLLGSLLVGWVWMSMQHFADEPLELEAPQLFEVPAGSSAASLGRRLQAMGALEQPTFFRWLARLEGKASRIQTGEYQLQPGLTPRALLQLLSSGKTYQHSLTIVEGWTFRQLLTVLGEHPALKQTLEGLSDAAIMARLGAEGLHPEGQFLPDTYHFPKGMSDLEFLRRARQALHTYLDKAWAGRNEGLPYKTPYEALIMASIVEKETGIPEERPAIAGVFVRRLKKGMRLQTDPTVIYGLGEAFDGNLRRADLKSDTPYNTYTRKGLPPTPIALPGRAAIDAAMQPEPGSALYFVATGDGGHHFSATLEEHNEAVVRYQLNGRRRPFSSSPK